MHGSTASAGVAPCPASWIDERAATHPPAESSTVPLSVGSICEIDCGSEGQGGW